MKELEKILSNPRQQYAEGRYSADQIREAYEAGLNADKWVDVKDELPSPGIIVRAITFNDGRMDEIKTIFNARNENFDSFNRDYITHWQYIKYPKV